MTVGYCTYARKNRPDCAEELAEQERKLLAFAEREGYEVTEKYSEIAPGWPDGVQPVLDSLIQDVAAGKFAGVIATRVNAITRSDITGESLAEALNNSGAELIIIDDKEE